MILIPATSPPSEVEILIGDSTKAKEKLVFGNRSFFTVLIAMMIENDLEEAQRDQDLESNGHIILRRFE